MTKKIPITKGNFVLVDNGDYEYLNQWKWYYNNGYARRDQVINGKKTKIYMHRFIMNCSSGFEVDHINANGLDNRRKNIRICSSSQNKMNNRIRKDNRSGYRGVHWDVKRKLWKVVIVLNGEAVQLGGFSSKTEAAKKYNRYAKKYFKEFARLNII